MEEFDNAEGVVTDRWGSTSQSRGSSLFLAPPQSPECTWLRSAPARGESECLGVGVSIIVREAAIEGELTCTGVGAATFKTLQTLLRSAVLRAATASTRRVDAVLLVAADASTDRRRRQHGGTAGWPPALEGCRHVRRRWGQRRAAGAGDHRVRSEG